MLKRRMLKCRYSIFCDRDLSPILTAAPTILGLYAAHSWNIGTHFKQAFDTFWAGVTFVLVFLFHHVPRLKEVDVPTLETLSQIALPTSNSSLRVHIKLSMLTKPLVDFITQSLLF